jgi:cytochrome c
MKRLFAALALLALLAPVRAPALAQDVAQGQKSYAKCKICHTIEAGGSNGVGPNLHGVFGAKAGTKAGFSFSPAMKNSNIVWSEETIAQYVADPRRFMPGNKMAFPGIKKADEMKDLIAYMKEAAK